MKIINANKYGQLNEKKLLKFEKKIKASLPKEYREFLLKCNGGEPSQDSFRLVRDNIDICKVESFWGLNNGPTHQRLDDSYEDYLGRMPKSILPIADDSSGNAICIGISGKEAGKIFFWDHDLEESPPSFNNIFLLSDSFSGFIEKLFEWEDPTESELENAIANDDLILLQKILSKNPDLEQEDEYGRTIIENAAIKNSVKIISFLYEKGANLRSSLKYAEKNAVFFKEHKKSVELLKSLSKKE